MNKFFFQKIGILALVLFLSISGINAQSKSPIFDIGVGFLNLQSSIHFPLDQKSTLGVEAIVGVMPVFGPYYGASAKYKLYYSAIPAFRKEFNRKTMGSFFHSAGITYMGASDGTAMNNDILEDIRLINGLYLSIGTGYEFVFFGFLLRPAFDFTIPVIQMNSTNPKYKKAKYMDELWMGSATSFFIYTLCIRYQF